MSTTDKKNNYRTTYSELKEELAGVKHELGRIKYHIMDHKEKHKFILPVKNCEKGSPTSMRIYKDDKEAFDNLCKTKFKDINKDALISLALAEFVEKYKD